MRPGWQMFHGVEFYGKGDVCVVISTLDRHGDADLYDLGVWKDSIGHYQIPRSEAHYVASEKMLEDYLHKKQVKELFRSDFVTVYRRNDGEESLAVAALSAWYATHNGKYLGSYGPSREIAENAARNALTDD